MRVAVIGAGIVGVTTAYELAADGHEVVVFERRGSVAAETSFANAGLVAPGYVTPWAAPGMPGKVLRSLFSPHGAVRIRGNMELGAVRWLWKWWRACRLRTYRANRARMHRLALYSLDRLHTLTAHLQLDYERTEGCLVLLRSDEDVTLAQPTIASLEESGTRFELLDAERCRTVEPGLNPRTPLAGGIYLPDDEVGNCRQFAHLLRLAAQRHGVRFRFHTTVRRIVPGATPQLTHRYAPPEATTLVSDPGGPNHAADTQPMPFEQVTENFDAVVVCAAMGAPALLRPLGLKLPMQAVFGHSVTAPLRISDLYPEAGPRSGLMDERYKVAVSRLGTRVRVAGGAEIGGSAEHHASGAFETLYKVLHDWFPGVARMNQAQRWKGARPMLPDGPPVLGASGSDGIWLNLGHGSSGWALSCGSARLLADEIAGRTPAIDVEGLGIERLRQ
ncbi:MAG: FAD-dependent oxidoreductase [Proteobacteria bacterium]|nr:FAD-dependent oxidoreductase [Pseudomonadota bacterium]